jgi:ATP-dependent helicase HepA
VRWLLADEVGLGKTIEASLILNRLVHTGTVDRVLVVAPDSLTVQWLGELWRKYHQVFTLLDAARWPTSRATSARFQPVRRPSPRGDRLETLSSGPSSPTRRSPPASICSSSMKRSGCAPPGHPGEPSWRRSRRSRRSASRAALSATPLEDDAHGFFRCCSCSVPMNSRGIDVRGAARRGTPLPPCTSSTRRRDIGGCRRASACR